MKPEDRLRSWKEEPPTTPKEASTAELLQTARSTPSLSAEALARVGHRVRENDGRPASTWIAAFGLLRSPVLGLASLLLVGGLTFFALNRPSSVGVLVAPKASERPASPPSAELAKNEPAAAEVGRSDQDTRGKRDLAAAESVSRRAAPAARDADRDSLGGMGALGSSRDEAQKTAPPAPAKNMSQLAAKKSLSGVQLADSSPEAAPSVKMEGAPPPAARPTVAGNAQPTESVDDGALLLRGEQLANLGRCADAVLPFSMVIDNSDDDSLIERALFSRARCRLALGQDAAARQDLEAYATRFPKGRFIDRARQLLR